MFEEWLKDKHELSESSTYYYMLGVRRFLAEAPDLENLEDYNKFLIKVMIKKRCSNYYSILKKFIQFEFEKDSIIRNKLIDGLIKPKMNTDIKVVRRNLKDEEIVEVINNLKREKHKIVALLQHLTGARAGDIMRLKRSHVIPDQYKGNEVLRMVLIGKRKKQNTVYLHDKIGQELLFNYMTTKLNWKEYVFIEKGNKKYREGNVNNTFMMEKMNYWWYWEDLKTALQTAGIRKEDFASHDFRRCFARKVWDKYKDIQVLQNLLNHTNPGTTLGYLKQSGLHNRDYQYEIQTGEKSD